MISVLLLTAGPLGAQGRLGITRFVNLLQSSGLWSAHSLIAKPRTAKLKPEQGCAAAAVSVCAAAAPLLCAAAQPGLPNTIRADASLGLGFGSAVRLFVRSPFACLFVCVLCGSLGLAFCGPSALGPKEMVRLNCVTVFAPTDTAIEAAANASALHGGEVCCIIMQRATDTCRAACSLRWRRTRPDSRQCKRDGQ
jgi:hypothetical protein